MSPMNNIIPIRMVEHDAEEIYRNVQKSIAELIKEEVADNMYSLAITNQRETVVVWNKHTGKPICNAVVWQCMRVLISVMS